MRRILSIIVENESGALSRIVALFSQRGYNIESLTVAPTEEATLSRITLQTSADKQIVEQIEKQLHKLINVLRVSDLTETAHLQREIMLVKLKATHPAVRDEIKRCCDIFRGQIVDITSSSYTIQLAGTCDKLSSFLQVIKECSEIIDMARSGMIGIARGNKSTH